MTILLGGSASPNAGETSPAQIGLISGGSANPSGVASVGASAVMMLRKVSESFPSSAATLMRSPFWRYLQRTMLQKLCRPTRAWFRAHRSRRPPPPPPPLPLSPSHFPPPPPPPPPPPTTVSLTERRTRGSCLKVCVRITSTWSRDIVGRVGSTGRHWNRNGRVAESTICKKSRSPALAI